MNLRKVTVNVTAKHIEEGEICDGRNCAVAKALIDILAPDLFPIVTEVKITIFKKGFGQCIYFPTPNSVKLFIELFDEGVKERVQPFSFEIELPEEYFTS